MKHEQSLIAGALIVGGLLALSTPAVADYRDRRRDLRDLEGARRELRSDVQRGANRSEIARDRAAIARERRDLWNDRNYWTWSRRHRHDHRHDRRYYNRWNRWGGWDRGWHSGWRR